MGLLRIPLVPALIGCVLLWMGGTRLWSAAVPAIDAACGSPELATHDHVRLHGCAISDAFYVGYSDTNRTAHWVVLSAPGTTAPSVLVEVQDSDEERALAGVTAALVRGELEVMRMPASAASEVTREFPAAASAALIGGTSAAGSSFAGMAWVYVGFGLLLCFVDVLRIGRWLVARTRGV